MKLTKHTLAIASIVTLVTILHMHFTRVANADHPLMCSYKIMPHGYRLEDKRIIFEGTMDRKDLTFSQQGEKGECAVYDGNWNWSNFCKDPTVIVIWNSNEALKNACLHNKDEMKVITAQDRWHTEYYSSEDSKPTDALTLNKVLLSF